MITTRYEALQMPGISCLIGDYERTNTTQRIIDQWVTRSLQDNSTLKPQLEKAVRKIKAFMESPSSTHLCLSDLSLSSLPEIFDHESFVNRLHQFECYKNELLALPETLGHCIGLRSLFVYQNKLSSLPSYLGQFVRLGWFYCSSNQLTLLPPELAQCSVLGMLNVSNNKLTSIPKELGSLSSLRCLKADDNANLKEIPCELLLLPKTCEVSLLNCPIAPRIHSQIQKALSHCAYRGPTKIHLSAPIVSCGEESNQQDGETIGLDHFKLDGQFKESQCVWLKRCIKEIVVDHPIRQITDIRPQIKTWISQLNSLSAKGKEKEVRSVINWILEDSSLTIEKMTQVLHVIEKIVLSRRISSLSEKALYLRIINGDKNRVITLNGVERYINFHHPQLPVLYLIGPDMLPDETFKVHLEKEKVVWIILQQGINVHKTLIMVSKTESTESCVVRIWDSLGVSRHYQNPRLPAYRRELVVLLEKIGKILPIEEIAYIPRKRQKDHMNCGSFVISDLENALELLAKESPLLLEKVDGLFEAHSAFFEISQYEEDAREDAYTRRLNNLSEKRSSSMALQISAHLLKFFLKSSATFAEKDHFEWGRSDSDEESYIF